MGYVRELEAADFSGLTEFSRNPAREEVCFLSLNNKGTVGEGVVTTEDGRVGLLGKSHRPDQTTEFKTILKIDEGMPSETHSCGDETASGCKGTSRSLSPESEHHGGDEPAGVMGDPVAREMRRQLSNPASR